MTDLELVRKYVREEMRKAALSSNGYSDDKSYGIIVACLSVLAYIKTLDSSKDMEVKDE